MLVYRGVVRSQATNLNLGLESSYCAETWPGLSLSSLQSGPSLPRSSSQSGTHYVPQKESSFRLLSLSFPLWRQSRRPTPTSSPPPPLRQSGDISRSRCICIPRSDGRREEFVRQIPSASGSKDLSGYPGPSCDVQAKYVQLFMFSPVKKNVEALFCPSIQRIKDPNEVQMVAGTTTALRRKTSRREARHPFGHEIRSVLQLPRS